MAQQVAPQTPFPTIEQVMNRARAIANDSYRQGKGRILTDDAPFTVEYLNGALEELQDRLRNNAVISLIQDNIILGPITALAGVNPAIQVAITYNGFFNGTEMVAEPRLPSNLMAPLVISERQIGSGLPFQPMMQPREGLPSCFQNNWLGLWEWRQDGLWFTGSTIDEEIRMRAQIALPIISPNSTASFADTQIAILASINALANLVIYQYARARGAVAAPTMAQDAEKFIKLILNRYTRQAQRVPYRRQPYSADTGNGSGYYGTNLPF
jgi:hypothetical protein